MGTVASCTFRAMDDASVEVFFGGFLKQWSKYTREGLRDQTDSKKILPRPVKDGQGGR